MWKYIVDAQASAERQWEDQSTEGKITKRPSTIAGLGAWTLALALNLGSSAWPEIIKPHPYSVLGLAIAGLLMFISPWLRKGLIWAQGRLYTENNVPDHPPQISVSTVKAPISNEVTVSPTISPVIAPVINISPVISPTISLNQSNTQIPPPAPIEAARPGSTAHTEKPATRLDLSFESMPLVYRLERSAWDKATQFDHDGREAIVAWFTNPVPPKGARGIDASQLSAHIKYSVEGHWGTQVSRGYWLHHSSNEITINTADRAGLILGLVDWSHWVSYANPYSRPASEGLLQPAFRPPGEEKKMPKVDMDIEISLLSNGTFTLDQQKIRLCFSNGRPYAVRYP